MKPPSDILSDLFPKFPETATREAVADIFESLDLDLDILQRKSYELSGGQKAKLLLLKMSMSGANVLILDEPTRNFSPLSAPESAFFLPSALLQKTLVHPAG